MECFPKFLGWIASIQCGCLHMTKVSVAHINLNLNFVTFPATLYLLSLVDLISPNIYIAPSTPTPQHWQGKRKITIQSTQIEGTGMDVKTTASHSKSSFIQWKYNLSSHVHKPVLYLCWRILQLLDCWDWVWQVAFMKDVVIPPAQSPWLRVGFSTATAWSSICDMLIF